MWLFLENLAECVSSSFSAQHELKALAALGRPLADTTGEASRVLYVGGVVGVLSVYWWLLSESVSNLCLCFRTSASTVSQQVQSVSVCVTKLRQL